MLSVLAGIIQVHLVVMGGNIDSPALHVTMLDTVYPIALACVVSDYPGRVCGTEKKFENTNSFVSLPCFVMRGTLRYSTVFLWSGAR